MRQQLLFGIEAGQRGVVLTPQVGTRATAARHSGVLRAERGPAETTAARAATMIAENCMFAVVVGLGEAGVWFVVERRVRRAEDC